MTENQIKRYEYCKKHIAFINDSIEKLPFRHQKYGCSNESPPIEHSLEKMHNEMYNEVMKAMIKAKNKIQSVIDNI